MNAIRMIQSILPIRATSESSWDMVDLLDSPADWDALDALTAPDLRPDEFALYCAPRGRQV